MDKNAIDWAAHSDAYGEASEIPAIIAQLSAGTTDPSHPLWDDLWGRLCHQGTVYPASYAALPLLLEYAESLPPQKRDMPLILVSAIVASDDLHGVESRPLDLIDGISRIARHLTAECLEAGEHDSTTFIYLLQAASTFGGDLLWGRHFGRLVDGEFDGRCTACERDLYLVIGRHGFFATTQEWSRPSDVDTTRLPIKPAEAGALHGRGAWLHSTAVHHGQAEVALWIRHLFGTVKCPKCSNVIEVSDAL